MWTNIEPFCILRTPFDTVFEICLTMVLTKSVVCKTRILYTIDHISGSRRSPDMILNVFYTKCQYEQKWDASRGFQTPNKIKTNSYKNTINASEDGVPARPTARPHERRVRGAAASQKTQRFYFWRV